MRYLLLSLFLVGCAKNDIVKYNELTPAIIERARCICKKFKWELHEVIRNETRINFNCLNMKTGESYSLYFYDTTYTEGCMK